MSRSSWVQLVRAALALVVAVGSFACDETSTSKLEPKLHLSLDSDPTGRAAYLIDFGAVPIGSRVAREIELENVGDAPLQLEAQLPGTDFALEQPIRSLSVGVGETRTIAFAFSPRAVSGRAAQAIATLVSNEPGGRSYTIRLQGEGISPSLDCDPGSVEFGTVLRGETKLRTITCSNPLPAPLYVGLDGFKGNAWSSFSARFISHEENSIELQAGASVELEFSFRASSLGKNEASLSLRDGNEHLLAQIEVRAETVESALQVEPPACLDFDYVELGGTRRAALRLRNIGPSELRVLEVVDAPDQGFKAVTRPPLTLLAGEGAEAEVLVEFQPTRGGLHTAEIQFSAEDSNMKTMTATACVSGFGGGPKLVCHPGALDFGVVAVGSPAVKEFLCVNDGFAPEGALIDNLIIKDLSSAPESFRATIRNRDGSVGAHPAGYSLGEEFSVLVSYDPRDERFDAGTIEVESNSGVEGPLELSVSGQGRILPPCDFSIIPPRLDFGTVDRGQTLELAFGIVNHGADACLIRDLRLSAGSDPSFSLAALPGYELDGFETLRVPVSFSPERYEAKIAGEVRFQISNPEIGEQRVLLVGTSEQPCLVLEPAALDFGVAEPGCYSPRRALMVRNVCSAPARIVGVELSSSLGSDQFVLTRPLLPMRLAPREHAEIGVTFAPTELGRVAGAVAVQVEGATPESAQLYLSTVSGEGVESSEQTDFYQQPDLPKVDILWVMDNSGSFERFQAPIAANLPAFVTYANEQGIDWHIAVTTTGLFPIQDGDCPGGVRGGEDGRFFPVDGSHPRILTRRTQDLDTHWRHNMMVGTCNGYEFPLEAGKRALSEPLISSEKDPRYPDSGYMDGNAGFLRPDASLSVIFVTDEEDHSTEPPADFLRFYQSVKGTTRPDLLKLHAITGPRYDDAWMGCSTVEDGDRILDVVDATDGVWLNICTPLNDKEAWRAGLEKMAEGAFGGASRFILRGQPAGSTLSGRATEEDIVLRIDGKIRDHKIGANFAWRYDPVSNAIDFTPFFTPPAGSQITATYQVACLTAP